MSACTFDESDWRNYPYKYYLKDGSQVSNGTLVDGVCVFPTPYCKDSIQCCKSTERVEAQTTLFWVPLLCFMVCFMSFKLLAKWRKQRSNQDKEVGDSKAGGNESSTDRWKLLTGGLTGWRLYLFIAFMIFGITATVMEGVIMPKSVQQNLTPTDRSAQLAMSSFLTPIGEIFAFLEDTMTVEVGYAVSAGNLSRLNLLLNVSVMGGVLSGLAAFILMLILCFTESSARTLLNPSESHNQILIDNGCDLIPTTSALLEVGRFACG
eukprot:jgi/Bigna1/147617/aug1.242_g22325